jgi:MSHA pilin protein MshA
MMNKTMKSAQSGFTLIELIVVIVILGILAATALPKFANLSGDARVSSLQAAKGALSATAAMAHGKYLINPGITTLTMEGQTITYKGTSGYPQADAGLAAAAGLGDYTVVTKADVSATTPNVGDGQIAIVPASVAGTATATTCYVMYTETATANTAPTISAPPTADKCE